MTRIYASTLHQIVLCATKQFAPNTAQSSASQALEDSSSLLLSLQVQSRVHPSSQILRHQNASFPLTKDGLNPMDIPTQGQVLLVSQGLDYTCGDPQTKAEWKGLTEP